MESSAKHLPYGKKGLYSDADQRLLPDVFSRMSDSVVQAVQDRLAGPQARGAAAVFASWTLAVRTPAPPCHSCTAFANWFARRSRRPPSKSCTKTNGRTIGPACLSAPRAGSPRRWPLPKDLADYGNVFVLATGTSFYRQCVAKRFRGRRLLLHRHALADRTRHATIPRRPALCLHEGPGA